MTDASHKATTIPKRSSIDMSLELERQLDSESMPGSPNQPTHPRANSNHASLDPYVLAHIVTQLRDSLAHSTLEKEGLIQQLAESHSREAEFKDSLALWTERCASLEKELEKYKKKSQDDDEAIMLLRSKVEESRRGVMRLQSERNAENKRMTLDLSHSRSPSFGGGPRSAHRASFAPLTGSGHPKPPSSFRRQSSVAGTENDPGFAEFLAGLPGSPGQTLIIADNVEGGSSQITRRRSMFGTMQRSSGGLLEGRSSPSAAELESLKRELAAAKAEVEETRNELTEANEAREASESCVKALRDYISQMGSENPSYSGQRTENVLLPPLPTDSHVNDIEAVRKPQKTSGWGGLNFWRVDTGVPSSSSIRSATSSHHAHRQSTDSRITGSDHDSISPSTTIPLRNKLGSLFTRTSSTSSASHPPPPDLHQDEPILNGSDVSSLTETSEPSSPTAEKAQTQPVFVREPAGDIEGSSSTHANKNAVYIQDGVGDTGSLKVVPV